MDGQPHNRPVERGRAGVLPLPPRAGPAAPDTPGPRGPVPKPEAGRQGLPVPCPLPTRQGVPNPLPHVPPAPAGVPTPVHPTTRPRLGPTYPKPPAAEGKPHGTPRPPRHTKRATRPHIRKDRTMTNVTNIERPASPVPKAPKGLKAEGRKMWVRLHTTYDFTDCPEKLILLEQACRTADLVHRLQSTVDAAEDLRVRGSQGQPVAAPEVGELRQYRALLTSLLKALTLPDDEAQAGTGKMTRSQLGRLGAQARWGGAVR